MSESRGQEINFAEVDVLTFDCYGTLIDWESGIIRALRAVLGDASVSDGELLESFARHESAAEAGPWMHYREVLKRSLLRVCADAGGKPSDAQAASFGASVAEWLPFADSVAALSNLATRFDLGVITNCDDDLFASSNERLGKPFRWIVTAEQARSYKPSVRNFELALERIACAPERVVHVAQSLFHDHVPAKAIGLRTIWINRRAGRHGAGATPHAEVTPHLTLPDMASLAVLATSTT